MEITSYTKAALDSLLAEKESLGASKVVVPAFTSAAIQGVIDALAAVGPGVVQLLAGTYFVDAKITIPNNIRLTGAGVGRTVLEATVAGLDAMVENADTVNGNTGIEIDNFTLKGAKDLEPLATGRSGVHTLRCTGSRVHDLEAYNLAGDGFQLEGSLAGGSGADAVRVLLVENLYSHDNANDGVWIKSGYREIIGSNLRGRSNARHGIHVDHSEAAYSNLYAYENGQYGIFIDNLHSGNFHGLVSARNGLDGIHLTSLRNSVGSSWISQCNGMSDPANSADIFFDDVPRGYGVHQNCVIDGIVCGYSSHYDFEGLNVGGFAARPIYLSEANLGQEIYLTNVVPMASARPPAVPQDLGYLLSAHSLRDAVAASQVPSGLRTVVNDSALRSGGDPTVADSGQIWTPSAGALWVAEADGLRCTNAGGGRQLLTTPVASNGKVSASITYGGGTGAALVARVADTANMLELQLTAAAFRIRKIVAGAVTVLISTQVTPVIGDRYRATFTFDGLNLSAELFDVSGTRITSLKTVYDAAAHTAIGANRNVGVGVTANDNAHFSKISALRGTLTAPVVSAAAVDAATTQTLVNDLRNALLQHGLVS